VISQLEGSAALFWIIPNEWGLLCPAVMTLPGSPARRALASRTWGAVGGEAPPSGSRGFD
jgi:hypothetical protein